MENKNKIFIGITTIITIVVVVICIFAIINYEEEQKDVILTDTEIFISEYEKLNGEVNSSNGKIYPEITIDSDLIVEIKSDDEIVNIMKEEKALIYFGFDTCPWCRSMLPSLTYIAKMMDQKIYYVDISEIRNAAEVIDGVAVETTKGTESYYEILDLLELQLSDYSVKDELGNQYPTGFKRLYAPTVLAIDTGNVVDIFIGGLEDVTDPYLELTERQVETLNDRFRTMIESLTSYVCDDTEVGC